MKKAMMKLSVLIIAAVLTQACSSPSEEPSAEQPQQQPASQAEKNPPPVATSTSAVTSVPQPASATGPQPKLLVPVKKIDFGTQRAGKSLMRTITVKNIGKVELKIESVVPS